MFWFIVDIIMIIVILVTTLISLNRGFVSAFVRVVGVFIALFVSVVLSKLLAEVIFNSLFRQSLIDSVAAKIDLTEGVEKAVEALSSGFIGLMFGLFGDTEQLTAYVAEALVIDERIIAQHIVDGVFKTPMVSLIKIILCVILFSIIIAIILLIAKSAGLLNRIPIIGGLNKFFGAVIGLVYGCVICIIIVSVIDFFIILSADEANSYSLIENHSLILAWLMQKRMVVML